MLNHDLPTYAIIELLIRLSEFNADIETYQQHHKHEYGVIVRTTNGHINLSQQIINQQLQDPKSISPIELSGIAASYKTGA